ncbi:MAG: OmpA family protein [Sulfitobacter sp.]
MKQSLCLLAMMVAGAAQAVELQLPTNARQMVTRDTVQDRYFAPIGVFADGVVPMLQLDGDVARSSWRIDQAGLTPLQLLAPMRAELEKAGYEIALDCAALACGGYDFRFETEVMPAPNMYINIRNFHALTAVQGQNAVTVLASATSGATFVQIIQAGAAAADSSIAPVANLPRPVATAQGDLAHELQVNGHAVLSGLVFESGTSALGVGPFEVLPELAQAMTARPEMRIALVGHTDNIGGLENNIALSRSRAAAVRGRLIETYGIAAQRLEAQGMGYLAPYTSNQTEAGRETNRRVEAVVLAN